ncbi:MAG: TM1266 family iron-only hydrogenase system putative regulator [Desulfovibrio sp.]
MTQSSPRIGLVGVTFDAATGSLGNIESVLAAFADVVVARMSLPQCAADTGLLTLVVNASTDQIGALAGRLGMLESVRVKSLVM